MYVKFEILYMAAETSVKAMDIYICLFGYTNIHAEHMETI